MVFGSGVKEPDVSWDGRMSLAHHDVDAVDARIARKYAGEIVHLDLSHNRFEDLRSVADFARLTTLVLDNNRITHAVHWPYFPGLRTLWLNRNRIDNLSVFIGRLSAAFPNLAHLSLMDNPCAPSFFNGGSRNENADYRLFTISRFPHLKHLDWAAVDDKEREEAVRVYPPGRLGGDDAAGAAGSSRRRSSSRRKASSSSSSSSSSSKRGAQGADVDQAVQDEEAARERESKREHRKSQQVKAPKKQGFNYFEEP